MHNSWKHLAIQSDRELRDIKRLKQLNFSSSIGLTVAAIGFGFAGVASFLAGAWMLYLTAKGELPWGTGLGVGLALLAFDGVAFFFVHMVIKERSLNLLGLYIKSPQHFEFVEGELTSASYSRRDSHSNSKFLVHGKGMYHDKEFMALEQFSSFIWPFVDSTEDDQIQEGDDWYDLKGKRVRLPVKAQFLVDKRNPNRGVLVAIDKSLVKDACKRAEKDF
ncbi:hypothetical protein [Bdellovibrio reynosensis]|uniref:Uncharacterized protein n=1 Tax=Bdellovibrio reynosensis TaxID=2835041 RepID=A0ABY4C9X5_9BACT|nr:hypothetical protein [Bdellovibrio reynosensis]UOF01539.1 hypothetical protein MNR06_01045 [Bdellovibrio reynosensis]